MEYIEVIASSGAAFDSIALLGTGTRKEVTHKVCLKFHCSKEFLKWVAFLVYVHVGKYVCYLLAWDYNYVQLHFYLT